MKFLAADPPASIPGQIAQGGRAGPFLRGGRLPVDPKRNTQFVARGALAYGTKLFRFADAATQTAWSSSLANGSTGTQKIAGTMVTGSLSIPAQDVIPWSATSAHFPDISTYFVSVSGGIVLDFNFPPDPLWEVWARIRREYLPGDEPSDVWTVWARGGVPFEPGADFTAIYLAAFGALTVGSRLGMESRLIYPGIVFEGRESATDTITA